MATEGPLIHDGSQTTANSNYGNNTSNLGNSSSGQFLAVQITAARVVSLCTTTGQASYGTLQNKPAAAAAADVGIWGPSKMQAGDKQITAGAKLMTNASGAYIPWTSGSGFFQIGVAIDAATGGQVFTGFTFGPLNPSVLT